MRLKIYAMTHKQFDVPKDEMYQPLHVGHVNAADLGYSAEVCPCGLLPLLRRSNGLAA